MRYTTANLVSAGSAAIFALYVITLTCAADAEPAYRDAREAYGVGVKLYEMKLKANPRNKPALYALSEIYRRAEPNPTRRMELLAVLREVQKQDEAKLARKFEALAVERADLAAAHWKDAAAAWLRADEKEKALAAVKNAEANGPERRNDLLAHHWHKGMGDAYLKLDQPKQAIPHFESAIKKTNIAGYIKACQEQLTKARAASDG